MFSSLYKELPGAASLLPGAGRKDAKSDSTALVAARKSVQAYSGSEVHDSCVFPAGAPAKFRTITAVTHHGPRAPAPSQHLLRQVHGGRHPLVSALGDPARRRRATRRQHQGGACQPRLKPTRTLHATRPSQLRSDSRCHHPSGCGEVPHAGVSRLCASERLVPCACNPIPPPPAQTNPEVYTGVFKGFNIISNMPGGLCVMSLACQSASVAFHTSRRMPAVVLAPVTRRRFTAGSPTAPSASCPPSSGTRACLAVPCAHVAGAGLHAPPPPSHRSMQGLFKFGLYEIFKDVYAGVVGPENAFNYRTFVFLAASASAEFFADMALCPMEAVKVRMQTSPPEAKFPTELSAAINKIKSAEGTNGFFKGLTPLWGRQIPYTMVKFAAFERVVEFFYNNVFTAGRENYGKSTQLGITFASGYIAGVFCAIVSHPADTIVSKLNQNSEGGIGAIVKEMGIWNLATKGLGARIFMIGTLTGLQWWIYDTFKVAVGLKTSGGK